MGNFELTMQSAKLMLLPRGYRADSELQNAKDDGRKGFRREGHLLR